MVAPKVATSAAARLEAQKVVQVAAARASVARAAAATEAKAVGLEVA